MPSLRSFYQGNQSVTQTGGDAPTSYPAPLRMVTGPGVIPGYVQDVNAMNAYQRQAYLPQNAGASYSPGVVGRAANEAESQQAFDRTTQDPYRRIAQFQQNALYGR